MMDDKLSELVRKVDRMAGPPDEVHVSIGAVRHRASRKTVVSLAFPIAAAVVLLLSISLWNTAIRTPQKNQGPEKITSLEAQVKELAARTDATLNLIQQVLEEERRQQRLDELEAQLASIPDPVEEMRKQVDKTAFILVYQADRLYRELNETESAVETYQRVIKLFPGNQWATVALQRLSEIKNRKTDKANS